MARVTVEDCIQYVPNRFELVILAAKRARQLAAGVEPTLPAERDKFTVLALREIGENNLDLDELRKAEIVVPAPEEEEGEELIMSEARALLEEESHLGGLDDEEGDLEGFDVANDADGGFDDDFGAALDEGGFDDAAFDE